MGAPVGHGAQVNSKLADPTPCLRGGQVCNSFVEEEEEELEDEGGLTWNFTQTAQPGLRNRMK